MLRMRASLQTASATSSTNNIAGLASSNGNVQHHVATWRNEITWRRASPSPRRRLITNNCAPGNARRSCLRLQWMSLWAEGEITGLLNWKALLSRGMFWRRRGGQARQVVVGQPRRHLPRGEIMRRRGRFGCVKLVDAESSRSEVGLDEYRLAGMRRLLIKTSSLIGAEVVNFDGRYAKIVLRRAAGSTRTRSVRGTFAEVKLAERVLFVVVHRRRRAATTGLLRPCRRGPEQHRRERLPRSSSAMRAVTRTMVAGRHARDPCSSTGGCSDGSSRPVIEPTETSATCCRP